MHENNTEIKIYSRVLSRTYVYIYDTITKQKGEQDHGLTKDNNRALQLCSMATHARMPVKYLSSRKHPPSAISLNESKVKLSCDSCQPVVPEQFHKNLKDD